MCFFRIAEVAWLQHLALVPDHLIDIDRIILAVVGTVEIDATDIFVLVRKFAQPGTSGQLFSSVRAYPYLAVADVTSDIRSVRLPPLNLVGSGREPAAAIVRAALPTLITVFHRSD